MRGTVKKFNYGYGFITDPDGKDFFVHQTQIQMEGFRYLTKGDYVEFEIGTTEMDGRTQAVNVTPVLTQRMVERALEKDGLHLCRTTNSVENAYRPWLVVDSNEIVQTSENGMSLLDVAAYAGIDVSDFEG